MSKRREQAIGAGAQVVTEVSINFGSSLAGLAIPLVGSPVVVAARQLVVIAALFGALVLGESFTLLQQIAIVVVCAAAGAAIATQRDRPKTDLERTADAVT